MQPMIIRGRDHARLADGIAAEFGIAPQSCVFEDFPDGELKVRVPENARGKDVFLIQATGPPVAQHLLELLLMADGCRGIGAGRITAVIPYFGYARQDRRMAVGEPLSARVIADLLQSRCDRLVLVDLHNAAIEGFFSLPTQHVSAVPLLSEGLADLPAARRVVVAPDLGAVKLARRYADRLDLPVACIEKVRLSGSAVQARRVIGDVEGCRPILVDDMISTGATIAAAAEVLLAANCYPEFALAATHGLFVDQALDRITAHPFATLLVSDSLDQDDHRAAPVQVRSLAGTLAEAIRKSIGVT